MVTFMRLRCSTISSLPSIRNMVAMSISLARPRHYRNYSAPNKAMWCCVGTGMENHGKYGQFVWTHDKGVKAEDDALYVNLFVASN